MIISLLNSIRYSVSRGTETVPALLSNCGISLSVIPGDGAGRISLDWLTIVDPS